MLAPKSRAKARIVLVVALVVGAVTAGGATGADHSATATVRVKVFFPRGDPGLSCKRVFPVVRVVAKPALREAMAALLRGPTKAERANGYGGWFSSKTAGKLKSARIQAGVALVDFRDLRKIIPNASSSCGSALLLAQLDRTAKQFAAVKRTIYSFNGSRSAFYEWLQRSPPA